MIKRIEPDKVFEAAGVADPFLDETNPYLTALLVLPPRERRIVVRQVTLLMAAVPGLDPEGGLEVLAKLGMWLNERPQTAEYHTLRLAGLQLFQKLQK